MWTDAALMARVQQGDAEAFAALYDRHGAAVFAAVGASEQILEATFLAAWRKRAAYPGGRSCARAWILSLAPTLLHNPTSDVLAR